MASKEWYEIWFEWSFVFREEEGRKECVVGVEPFIMWLVLVRIRQRSGEGAGRT